MPPSPEGQESDAENGQGLEEQLRAAGEGEEVEIQVAEIKHTESSSSEVAPRVHFQDHFTLKNPSGTVRYRGSNVRVLEQRSSQILLVQRCTADDDDQKRAPLRSRKSPMNGPLD